MSVQTHLMASFSRSPKRKAVNFLSNVVLTAGKNRLFGVSSKTTKARPDTAAQHKMRRRRFMCRTCLEIAARYPEQRPPMTRAAGGGRMFLLKLSQFPVSKFLFPRRGHVCNSCLQHSFPACTYKMEEYNKPTSLFFLK